MYSLKKLLKSEPAAVSGVVAAVLSIVAMATPISPELGAAIVSVIFLVLNLAYVRANVTPTSHLVDPDFDENE